MNIYFYNLELIAACSNIMCIFLSDTLNVRNLEMLVLGLTCITHFCNFFGENG